MSHVLDPNRLNEQYGTGMNLELAVDDALSLHNTAALLDDGAIPGERFVPIRCPR